MKNLLTLALELSREMKDLKVLVQLERRKISNSYSSEWLDGEKVMTILKISKRTLQSLRDNGVLPYSQVNGKLYYKAEDIMKILEGKYLKKGKQDCRL